MKGILNYTVWGVPLGIVDERGKGIGREERLGKSSDPEDQRPMSRQRTKLYTTFRDCVYQLMPVVLFWSKPMGIR